MVRSNTEQTLGRVLDTDTYEVARTQGKIRLAYLSAWDHQVKEGEDTYPVWTKTIKQICLTGWVQIS